MSNEFCIAGVQMTVEEGDGNLGTMKGRLKAIKNTQPEVELVVFSELAVYGHDPAKAEAIPGEASRYLAGLAKEFGIWLVPGSLNEKTSEGIYNTALVINPRGEIIATYRKRYPWRPSETTRGGDSFCVFDIPGRLKIGLCICYDQWFPEIARQLTWMGAQVILCPTMTTTPDRPLELILSQANAIANQVYFININGLGIGGNGYSIIVDPEGKILQSAEEEEKILTVGINADKIRNIREEGTLGACQVLKSFRDENVRFPVYSDSISKGPGFRDLGVIKSHIRNKPGTGS